MDTSTRRIGAAWIFSGRMADKGTQMNGSTHRIRAILEVVSVFLLTFLVIGVVSGSSLDVAPICALPYSIVFGLLSLAGSGAGAWRPLLGGALAVGVLSTFAWLLKKKPGFPGTWRGGSLAGLHPVAAEPGLRPPGKLDLRWCLGLSSACWGLPYSFLTAGFSETRPGG
jgi:hypothetical protein